MDCDINLLFAPNASLPIEEGPLWELPMLGESERLGDLQ